jgi:hypothetical protein
MVKMQHKTRRDGIINVCRKIYKLDSEGCVIVPEEAAEKMLQGFNWVKVDDPNKEAPKKPVEPPPVPIEKPKLAPKVAVEKPPLVEDPPKPMEEPSKPMEEPSPVNVSWEPGEEDDPALDEGAEGLEALGKSELIARAEEMGLEIDRRTSKQKIIAAIKAIEG